MSIGHLSISLRRNRFCGTILHVGAVCTHHDLATSAVVASCNPGAGVAVGDRSPNPRIRFRDTWGGNLMARHPDYEGPALLAAAGTTSVRDTAWGENRLLRRAVAAACDVSGWLLEGVEVHCERDLRIEYDRSHKGVAGVVLGLTLDGNRIVGARAATTWAYAHLHYAELPVARMPVAALLSEARALAADWASALPEPVTNYLASNRYRRRILESAIASRTRKGRKRQPNMTVTQPMSLRFTLNGREQEVAIEPNKVLADVLREDLGLTGTKVACDQGVCGACTVLIDGRPMASCTEFAFMAEGRSVTTIEGLGSGRCAPSDSAGIHRGGGDAMRLLHARHDPAVAVIFCATTRIRTKPCCASGSRAPCADAPATR